MELVAAAATAFLNTALYGSLAITAGAAVAVLALEDLASPRSLLARVPHLGTRARRWGEELTARYSENFNRLHEQIKDGAPRPARRHVARPAESEDDEPPAPQTGECAPPPQNVEWHPPTPPRPHLRRRAQSTGEASH